MIPSCARVEQLALDVLERNALRAAPVDVDLIVEREGIRVEVMALNTLEGCYFDLDGLSGNWVRMIAIREASPPSVQRFTKAHELGHHFLDKVLPLSTRYRKSRGHWVHELFAAALLMPAEEILEAARSTPPGVDHLTHVAQLFAVSAPAAFVRLQDLGFARSRPLAEETRRRRWSSFRELEKAMDPALA